MNGCKIEFCFSNSCRICFQVYDRLQPLGICVSHSVTNTVLHQIGGHFDGQLIEAVKEGRKFRIVGDNINFNVDTSHLKNIGNGKKHMEHWFGSAAIVQNHNFHNLSPITPNINLAQVSENMFIPNDDDTNALRDDYYILIMRVLTKFCPAFKSFKKLLPQHIRVNTELNTNKNKVIPLPILNKNEHKYDDVICILDDYESTVKKVYDEAGKAIKAITTVHVGGDQLTRCRFSGAKRLRAGALTNSARFEHLGPISFEFFHLQMAILTLIYQILYDDKINILGTLYAEKVRLNRTRADGNDVKNHYDDCKELFLSVTDSYIVEAACQYFGMGDVSEKPSRNLPENFESLSDEGKNDILKSAIGEMIDKFVWPHTGGKLVDDDNSGVAVKQMVVTLPDGSQRLFLIPCNSQENASNKSTSDAVKTYAENLLELGMLYKNLNDAITTPNLERMKQILKYSMLILKGHNNLSKYALEILRYLFQLYTLSEREANELFYGQFVNTHSKVHSFIPADLRMEYLVRLTKSHIKAVQSNKNEGTLVKRTSAFAGISEIAENFDNKTMTLVRAHKHKIPSSFEDEILIINSLKRLSPFQEQGREIPHKKLPKSPILKISKYHLLQWIKEHQIDFSYEY